MTEVIDYMIEKIEQCHKNQELKKCLILCNNMLKRSGLSKSQHAVGEKKARVYSINATLAD